MALAGTGAVRGFRAPLRPVGLLRFRLKVGDGAAETIDEVDIDVVAGGPGPIYVAGGGDDSALGTAAAPVATLERAEALAASSGRPAILIAWGTYAAGPSGVLTMQPGQAYAGRFHPASWIPTAVPTVLEGQVRATDPAIGRDTVLDAIEVRSSGPNDGASRSVALVLNRSSPTIRGGRYEAGPATTSIGGIVNYTDQHGGEPLIVGAEFIGGTATLSSDGLSVGAVSLLAEDVRATGGTATGSNGMSTGLNLYRAPGVTVTRGEFIGSDSSDHSIGIYLADRLEGVHISGAIAQGGIGANKSAGVFYDTTPGSAPCPTAEGQLPMLEDVTATGGESTPAPNPPYGVSYGLQSFCRVQIQGGRYTGGPAYNSLGAAITDGSTVEAGEFFGGEAAFYSHGLYATDSSVRGAYAAGGPGTISWGITTVGGVLDRVTAVTTGCDGGADQPIALRMFGSPRVTNSMFFPGRCSSNWAHGVYHVLASNAGSGPDFHSNLIRLSPASVTVGVALVSGESGLGPQGRYRNNIVDARGGTSDSAAFYVEQGLRPVEMAHNDLLAARLVYVDGTTPATYTTTTQVNGLSYARANISAPPTWVDPSRGDYHLTASATALIDAGTAEGAPAEDMDGDARPHGAAADIGPDEFLP